MTVTPTNPTDAKDRIVPVPDSLPEQRHPEPRPPEEAGRALKELAERARFQMSVIGHAHDWVPSPGEDAYNVLIIGGGQAGLGAAFACRRHRIDRVKVLESGPADEVGCWSRYARMHTLRSPKHMKGVELDIPALHPRCWFEAKYGPEAWDATTLVPRLDWNEYLTFYREVTGAEVDFHTTVTEVLPPAEDDAHGLFRVHATTPDGEVEYRARRVVFSLGLDGGGGPFVPGFLRALPEGRVFHTEEMIDFDALAGKRVLVLGGGASGFDNAGEALERGAASVEVHMRRGEVPRQNSLRWMEFPGMQEHFYDLSDEQKWEFSLFNGGLPQPPTQATIWRAFSHADFRLVKESRWAEARMDGDEIVITDETGKETRGDVVISATGYVVDLSLRPELARFIDDIEIWSDVHDYAAGHPLGKCPYLGDGFQFTPRDGGPEYISRMFHLSTGARASHGVAGNQLSGIFAGLKRLGERIACDITVENWPDFMADFREFEYEEVKSVGPHEKGDPWFAQSPRY